MEACTAPVGATPRSASSDGLKRAISRSMLLLFVVGDVLGAGIYALAGTSASGSAARSGPSFLLARVLAAFTAAAYAELVTKYPQAAGAALYVHKAFKRAVRDVHGRLRGDVLRRHVGDHAGDARSAATTWASSSTVPTVLVALAFIVVVALINFRGIGGVVRLQPRAAR